jgi:DNA-binding NarL/FixJ family response regulator
MQMMGNSLHNSAGAGLGVVADAVEEHTTVLIAGFEGMLAAGLREVLSRERELRVVGTVAAGDLGATLAEHRPKVALISHEALRSVVGLRRIVLSHPEVGLVIVSTRPTGGQHEQLLAAGAHVVVPITADARDLCAAVRLVARGWVGPGRPRRDGVGTGVARLTSREAEVYELLLERQTASEIATAMHITPATVNTHRRRIYEKLGVHSRNELAGAAELLEAEPVTDDLRAPMARDRLPLRRRVRAVGADRPSVIDIRSALGIARWRR